MADAAFCSVAFGFQHVTPCSWFYVVAYCALSLRYLVDLLIRLIQEVYVSFYGFLSWQLKWWSDASCLLVNWLKLAPGDWEGRSAGLGSIAVFRFSQTLLEVFRGWGRWLFWMDLVVEQLLLSQSLGDVDTGINFVGLFWKLVLNGFA